MGETIGSVGLEVITTGEPAGEMVGNASTGGAEGEKVGTTTSSVGLLVSTTSVGSNVVTLVLGLAV